MSGNLNLYLLVIAITTSCISYSPMSDTNKKMASEIRTGFVLNIDDYKREGRILKHSKRYELISDSASSDVSIELKRLGLSPAGCVTPQVTVMIFTLGFYPVRFREKYYFEYNEISKGVTTCYSESIEIEKIVSWFHLFSPRKSRNRAIGKSMNANLLEG